MFQKHRSSWLQDRQIESIELTAFRTRVNSMTSDIMRSCHLRIPLVTGLRHVTFGSCQSPTPHSAVRMITWQIAYIMLISIESWLQRKNPRILNSSTRRFYKNRWPSQKAKKSYFTWSSQGRDFMRFPKDGTWWLKMWIQAAFVNPKCIQKIGWNISWKPEQGRGIKCIRITSYRSYFLERKCSMQFFVYQQFSKTKDSLNLQVGRTELIQSILVIRQLYLADHLGLSDAVAFYMIYSIKYIKHILSKKDVQATSCWIQTWNMEMFHLCSWPSSICSIFVRRRWRRTSPTLLQHTLQGSSSQIYPNIKHSVLCKFQMYQKEYMKSWSSHFTQALFFVWWLCMCFLRCWRCICVWLVV